MQSRRDALPGDTILLAPAETSTAHFPPYSARGDACRALAIGDFRTVRQSLFHLGAPAAG